MHKIWLLLNIEFRKKYIHYLNITFSIAKLLRSLSQSYVKDFALNPACNMKCNNAYT